MPEHEQNDDMLDEITQERMHKIDNTENKADLILALHEARKTYVVAYRPPGARHHHDLLDVVHEAQILGDPRDAKIYSPPNVTSIAHRYNMRAGSALDLTIVVEDDGEPWKFELPEKRGKARRIP